MPTGSNNANFEPPDTPGQTDFNDNIGLVIDEGAPLHSQLKSLKCSDVRWFFKNRKGELEAFNGNDSLTLEIMYRFKNGQNLDPDAQWIYDKYLEKFYFEKLESSGISVLDILKPSPLILNHSHKVSEDLTSISPVFWEGKPISIERAAYLTVADEIIEPGLARDLQRKQEEALVGNYPHEASIEIKTKSGRIERVHVVWFRSTQLTIHREDENTRTIIKHYREKATWNEDHSKVDHLVFTVHGIWHNESIHSIVDCAEGLNEGVNNQSAKKSGVVFMPIHWRTNLYEGKQRHNCPKVRTGKSAFVQNRVYDLKMYHCYQCGPKIKEKVVSEFNRLYTQFLFHHPNFKGCISLFGHSLGSVICYDILTEQPMTDKLKFQKPVDKLFTVGSPLWNYFQRRGKESLTKFMETVETLPIYNIYHPNDPIAGRLEHLVDAFYKDTPPIGIPKCTKGVSSSIAGVASQTTGWIRGGPKIQYRKDKMLQGVPYLKFPIDYRLEIGDTWSDTYSHWAHSIYWTHTSVFKTLDYIFTQEFRHREETKKPEITVKDVEVQVMLGLENLFLWDYNQKTGKISKIQKPKAKSYSAPTSQRNSETIKRLVT